MNTTELNGKQYTMKVNADGTITLVPVALDDCDFVPQELAFYVQGNGSVSGMWDELNAAFHVVYRTVAEAEKASTLMRRSNAIIRACMLVDADAGVYQPSLRRYFPSLEKEIWTYNGWDSNSMYSVPCCVSSNEKAKLAAALLNKWGVK